MSYLTTLTAEEAFLRYEAVRDRLPQARFPARWEEARDLSEIAHRYDAFVLDAFGVLNVGATPIAGAVGRMAELRARGKRLAVLTNAASDPKSAAVAKYGRLGFDFSPREVVASREVCATRLEALSPGARWGAVAARGDDFSDLGSRVVRWSADAREAVDGFLLLSSADLDGATVDALTGALRRAPRPVAVANPDLVAPRETGLSCEPGFYAHHLADETGARPVFFGKPFGDAFEDALARFPGIPRHRVAMVGDSLHTDILGGAAAGLGTVLIRAHGLLAGMDVEPFIARSGIVPDVVCETT